ncbi:hypothetical protein SAMN02745126_02409 [Enhydrobacter aerosaccus]|uniref:tRNA_anti-like n=1 Tax=Enhydrobacter aerosaccus TaxID=225324 RepID=A0A1T4NRD4_9HYPH|nr:hypothetical protein [Enhydrobacter aerosaccus]SJZ81793.1 hypothetical protein SAMN02745126_02409 [Enhydrobacter aerosaccus]
MKRLVLPLAALLVAGPVFAPEVFAQKPPAESQTPSSYYPAPPPLEAPKVEQGAPVSNLTSPLAQDQAKVARTVVDSEAEAQMFAGADKIVWGRYAKTKGEKPGAVTVTKGTVWTVKGRVDSTVPGAEGDYASIDGVVERISANNITIRGEVAFRVAKIQNGTACKVGGALHFKRSGKSHVWRLSEGDNPCDGTREFFDLVYDKAPAEKKPVPAQPKRT